MRREASPGKLGPLEEVLFRHSEMADAPIVAAVALGSAEGARSVGVAFANLTSRQLGACEFADDEQFCSLEAVLLQIAAKEVVLAAVSVPLPCTPNPPRLTAHDGVAAQPVGQRQDHLNIAAPAAWRKCCCRPRQGGRAGRGERP